MVFRPLPQPKNTLTFAKENSSLPKTIIKRLLAVTLVTLKKKILHYSSPHWIIQTRQPNKSTGCPGNCFLDNQEDGGGRRAGEMSEQQCYIKEAKAPSGMAEQFPQLVPSSTAGNKKGSLLHEEGSWGECQNPHLTHWVNFHLRAWNTGGWARRPF